MSEEQNNNNQDNNNEQQARRNERRARRIAAIQRAAKNPKTNNGLARELTENQALSIMLRSRQLFKEGSYHPQPLSDKEYFEQVEECYRQRYGQN